MKKDKEAANNPETLEHPLAQLVRSIELSGIQLVSSEFFTRMPPEFFTQERVALSVNHSFRASIKVDEQSNGQEIFCLMSSVLVGKLSENDPEYSLMEKGEALSGTCTFVVRYKVISPLEITNEMVTRLAKSQGMFQAFPYARAYFDSQFSAMGIQGIVLPLLKPNNKTKKPEPNSAQA